jgi:O-antigen/teichoic acid export membrane protein
MKSIVWLACSRGLMQGISFISTLVVMRLLTPSDYGLMALAAIWTTTVSWLVQLGLGAAIVQHRDVTDDDLNACFFLVVGLAALGWGGLYAVGPALGRWFASPMFAQVSRVLSAGIVLSALRLVPESLLRQRLAVHRIAQGEIVAWVLGMTTVITAAWHGAGVWALVAGTLANEIVWAASSYYWSGWRPGLRARGTALGRLLRYGLTALGSSACWLVYAQADQFILGKVGGERVVGFYAMARSLATVVAEKIPMAVNQIAAPLMAELQTDRDRLRVSLLRALQLIAWVTFPLAAGVLLTGDVFVDVVLTEKWQAALPILYPLCVFGVVQSLGLVPLSALSARFRVGLVLRFHVILVVAMPAGFLVGALTAGGVGTAVVWATVYPLGMLWIAGRGFREVGASWSDVAAVLARPLAATGVMCAGLLVWRAAWVHWGFDVNYLEELSLIAAGGVGYGAGLLAFGAGVVREIAAMVVRRREKVA